MNTEERNQIIVDCLDKGMSLSDLQKLLADEYNEKISYMDLRILTSELAFNWEKRDKPKKAAAPAQPQLSATAAPLSPAGNAPEAIVDTSLEEDSFQNDLPQDDEAETTSVDGVQVIIDETPMPRTALSGTVTFRSGTRVQWFMDRFGRMGLGELPEGAAQPTEEDFQEFQAALQEAMQLRAKKLQEMAENGNTQVDISPIQKPGCELNGSVVFDSGIKGEWMLIQGKVEFQLDDPSKKPSQQEMAAFQYALGKKLREKGYR